MLLNPPSAAISLQPKAFKLNYTFRRGTLLTTRWPRLQTAPCMELSHGPTKNPEFHNKQIALFARIGDNVSGSLRDLFRCREFRPYVRTCLQVMMSGVVVNLTLVAGCRKRQEKPEAIPNTEAATAPMVGLRNAVLVVCIRIFIRANPAWGLQLQCVRRDANHAGGPMG